MEKECLVDETKCKTWEECLEWADTSLRDRNRMKVEDEGDEKWRAYLMHPLYVCKKILWKEGSEAWGRLSKDAWSYVNDLEEKGVDVYALNADYWGEWVSDHERDYMREAYDGSEFRDIVRDVAEELADDLGIEVDEG